MIKGNGHIFEKRNGKMFDMETMLRKEILIQRHHKEKMKSRLNFLSEEVETVQEAQEKIKGLNTLVLEIWAAEQDIRKSAHTQKQKLEERIRFLTRGETSAANLGIL